MTTHFEFKRFKPSIDLALYANTMLMQVLDYLRSGTIEEARMVREKGKYRCVLSVKLPDQALEEDAVSADPKTAVALLGERVKEKMMEWNVEHFTVNAPSFWDFKEVH